jgi:hypothetical protein
MGNEDSQPHALRLSKSILEEIHGRFSSPASAICAIFSAKCIEFILYMNYCWQQPKCASMSAECLDKQQTIVRDVSHTLSCIIRQLAQLWRPLVVTLTADKCAPHGAAMELLWHLSRVPTEPLRHVSRELGNVPVGDKVLAFFFYFLRLRGRADLADLKRVVWAAPMVFAGS